MSEHLATIFYREAFSGFENLLALDFCRAMCSFFWCNMIYKCVAWVNWQGLSIVTTHMQNHITQVITYYPRNWILSSYWRCFCDKTVLKMQERNVKSHLKSRQSSFKISVKEFIFMALEFFVGPSKTMKNVFYFI